MAASHENSIINQPHRSPIRTRIKGTGSYLPEKVLTNADLEKLVETNNQWIIERTGIRTRHLAADNQTNTDLALIASQRALEAAGLKAEDLDLIIYATVTPDRLMPSCATVLQKKLGSKPMMAFDLNAACTGWLYSFHLAETMVKSGLYQNVLVVGSEVLHAFVDYKDRETCILFGDGAGAAILGPALETQKSQVYSSHLTADGQLAELLTLEAGGSAKPGHSVTDPKLFYIRMQGREIFKSAVRAMVSACGEALKANSMDIAEVSWLIPHQANFRIIEAVASYFKFPVEKCIINVDRTGNTSAATIPIALDEAIRSGRIERDQNILLTAFGAGLTSGSVLLRY